MSSIRLSKSIFDICSARDIFSGVIEFLTFKDVFNLFSNKVSKEMTELLKKFKVKVTQRFIIRRQFEIFVKKFNLSPIYLMASLGSINAVIAGGFALSLFTGELHDSSDINIFIPSETHQDFKRKIKSSSIEKYLLKKGYIKIQTNKPNICYEEAYEEFENKNIQRKVQLILHFYNDNREPFCNVSHSIINNFDFTIAKCYIKRYWRDSDCIQFNCSHINDVMKKVIQININCPNQHLYPKQFKKQCVTRFLKYRSKGFKLSDDINFDPYFQIPENQIHLCEGPFVEVLDANT